MNPDSCNEPGDTGEKRDSGGIRTLSDAKKWLANLARIEVLKGTP